MNIIYLIVGIVFGFLFFTLSSGKKKGKIKNFIVILKTKNHQYHFHHWIIAFLIILILISFGYYNNFIYGFLIGSILQGLTYRDRYKFLMREKKKK